MTHCPCPATGRRLSPVCGAITVVSARLGHSQVSITLDVYSHLMPNDGAAAAAVIGRALYGETGT